MKHVLWGHLKLFVEMKNEEVLFAVVFLTMSFALNAANEVVNLAFRRGQCGFLQMADVIEETLQRMPLTVSPTLEDYLQCDAESRRMAASILGIS